MVSSCASHVNVMTISKFPLQSPSKSLDFANQVRREAGSKHVFNRSMQISSVPPVHNSATLEDVQHLGLTFWVYSLELQPISKNMSPFSDQFVGFLCVINKQVQHPAAKYFQ